MGGHWHATIPVQPQTARRNPVAFMRVGNEFRLVLAALAYKLMQDLKRLALKDIEL